MAMSSAEVQYPWRALPAFADVARRFLRPLDLAAVLEETLTQVESFGYTTCSILFVDREGKELHLQVHRGSDPRWARKTRFPIGEQGIPGWVAQNGQSYYAPDIRQDPLAGKSAAGKGVAGVRSQVAFPLIAEDQVIGVLDVRSPEVDAFPREVREALDALVTLAALAIYRARQDEKLHKLALTDDLTGLANHRGLAESLEREIARARRFGYPVSLVLVEIDKFKQVNDRYGHLRGDAALRAVAQTMRKVCRTMDVAARSGGDEFVLLLPQTPKIAAARVAERLRRQLAQHPFGDEIRLTASLGVATMPSDESAAESLLEAADRAMYQVKRAGGDRVGIA
jgi:diguanylate cyclase (GGDEF)-like protein